MASSVGSAGARLVAGVQIIVAIIALFAASMLIGGLVKPLLPEVFQTPVLAMAMWGGVIAGAVMLWLSKTSYREIGFKAPKNWLACLGWTVVAVVVAEAGALAIGMIIKANTDWPPLDTAYIRTAIEGNLTAYLVWMVLVVWGSAGFGEEFLARGFIMNRFERIFGSGKVGIVLAVLGQAAIFGGLHAIQGMTGVIITAYVGVVLAWVYYASGRNLWAPILAHGLIDTIAMTIMYLDLPMPGHIQ